MSVSITALTVMPYLPGISAKIAMTTIGVALPTVIYVISNAVISEITPTAQRGALLAIGTAVGTSAGLLAPYVMGSVVQDAINAGASAADGYMHGFLICGLVAFVCGLTGVIFLRPQDEAARFAKSERQVAAVAAE